MVLRTIGSKTLPYGSLVGDTGLKPILPKERRLKLLAAFNFANPPQTKSPRWLARASGKNPELGPYSIASRTLRLSEYDDDKDRHKFFMN